MKVIFLPGFLGGQKDFLLIKHYLKKDFEPIFFKYNTWLNEPIENISKKLKTFIQQNTKKHEKIHLIGLSAGGIIATYYAKFLDNKKVEKLITICSPLQGTYLTKIFSKKHKGLKQLSLNSDFLKKLNKNKSNFKQLNIWCYIDPLVPGKSARGNNPKHTLFFLHWFIQYWPPTLLNIKKFLKK